MALACSVPDCRAPRLKRFYLLTALLSFAWVGVDAWFLLLWILKVSPLSPPGAHTHCLIPLVMELFSLLRLLLLDFALCDVLLSTSAVAITPSAVEMCCRETGIAVLDSMWQQSRACDHDLTPLPQIAGTCLLRSHVLRLLTSSSPCGRSF